MGVYSNLSDPSIKEDVAANRHLYEVRMENGTLYLMHMFPQEKERFEYRIRNMCDPASLPISLLTEASPIQDLLRHMDDINVLEYGTMIAWSADGALSKQDKQSLYQIYGLDIVASSH